MIFLKRMLLVMLIIFTANSLTAQTVDEIIDRHVAAMGGRAKLAALKSVYQEVSMGMPVMGSVMRTKSWTLDGIGVRMETSVPNQGKIVQVITKNKAWMIDPQLGQTEMTKEQVAISSKGLYTTDLLFNYKEKGYIAAYLGKEEINDNTCYKIMLTPKTGETLSEIVCFLDVNTFYIQRNVTTIASMGTKEEIEVNFSDYKKTPEGYLFPYQTSMKVPGLNNTYATAITDKYEVNIAIDPKLFEKGGK